jgi:hypothetical protein
MDVAGADDSALDAEHVAESDIQSAAEYRKPRGNYFGIRRRPSCRSALVEIDRGFATIDSTPQAESRSGEDGFRAVPSYKYPGKISGLGAMRPTKLAF